MYRQRIEKVASLKPITITYNDAEVTLLSVSDFQALLVEALQEDVRCFLTITSSTNINYNNNAYSANSRVKEVKAKIFNAYLNLTDDFRDSIYQ